MAIKTKHKKSGYSATTATEYVIPTKPIHSLSTELEPFQVKFEDKVKLPEFLSLIEFENLQAVEVRYNVYFKADGIKEVK